MPTINIYKSHETRSPKVEQTYYVGGMYVIVFKDGRIKLAYNTPAGKQNEVSLENSNKKIKIFIERMIKYQGGKEKQK